MWRKSAGVLICTAILLVGCNNKKAVEDTRTETPMEDVNRDVNTGVTDEGVTNDGVNNGARNGSTTTDIEQGVNNGMNDVERGVNDVTEDVERGVNDVLPGNQPTPNDRVVTDDEATNGNNLHHDNDDNK